MLVLGIHGQVFIYVVLGHAIFCLGNIFEGRDLTRAEVPCCRFDRLPIVIPLSV